MMMLCSYFLSLVGILMANSLPNLVSQTSTNITPSFSMLATAYK